MEDSIDYLTQKKNRSSEKFRYLPEMKLMANN